MKLSRSRWLIAVAAAFPLLCAYSCAVPLGPGYHIEKETVELTFVNQPAPALHLDGHYRLENVGNAPLTSLEVTVPDKDSLARQNLHITVDGKDAQVTEHPASNGTMSFAQITFDPAWAAHEKKDIEIACDMAAGSDSRAVLAPEAVALDGADWFPLFQAPKRVFAKGEPRAIPTDLSFILPADFLAVASGLPTGRKAHAATVEYRFRMRATDGPVFVVAGRYKNQQAKAKGAAVHFWTFQGLPEDAVNNAGGELAVAAQFFDSSFVARARGSSPLWVAEIPGGGPTHPANGVPENNGSFPSAILLGKDALSQNIGHGQVSPVEIRLLSDTWLRWMATPAPISPVLPSALENYMVDAFYASQSGAPDRRMKIAEYLRQYDASPALPMEKPIAQVIAGDSADQVNMAVNKASLFLYALEDACKPETFRHAIGAMLTTTRGGEYGYEDLRAAVNYGCGKSSGVDPLFRPWLYEKGIPADFRARYAAAAGAAGAK